MDLLSSLGVNSTLAYQFVQFVVVYFLLKYVLFRPYFAAYNERAARTVGKTELAERYVIEARELEERYAKKAQDVNAAFKAVYDQTRAEAVKEYDRLLNDARTKVKASSDQARTRIESEMSTARAQLGSEVNAVVQLINHKLIGKEFNT